jgi:uncharacterized protein (DUF1778 family)
MKPRKTVDAAELEILERRNVAIPANDWKAFLRWANRPPEVLPGLKALASTRAPWEKARSQD